MLADYSVSVSIGRQVAVPEHLGAQVGPRQNRNQPAQALELRRGKVVFGLAAGADTANHTGCNTLVILPFDVGPGLVEMPPKLYCTVAPDNAVIAHVRPAVIVYMPVANFVEANIAICPGR